MCPRFVFAYKKVEVEYKPHLGKAVVHVYLAYVNRKKELKLVKLRDYRLTKTDLEKLSRGEIPKKLVSSGTAEEQREILEDLTVRIDPKAVLAELLRQEERLHAALNRFLHERKEW